jgi:hypothetical protein
MSLHSAQIYGGQNLAMLPEGELDEKAYPRAGGSDTSDTVLAGAARENLIHR